MNARKLFCHALQSPGNLRFSEALQLAAAFGFHRVRTSGSHHILSRPGDPPLGNLQNVNGKAKGKNYLTLEGTEQ